MIAPKLPKQTAADERVARDIVNGRDEGICVRCRRAGVPTNWDHRQNRSQLGRWRAANGQLLCGSGTTGCHGWKTSNPKAATEEGYSVPSWVDPAEWPARRYFPTPFGTVRLGWCLYDDDGGVTEISDAEAAERMAA